MRGFKIICENCGSDLAEVIYVPDQYWSEYTQEPASCSIVCPICESYYGFDIGYYGKGDIDEISRFSTGT